MRYVIGLAVVALLGLVGWRVYAELAKNVQQRQRGAVAVPVRLAKVEAGPVRHMGRFTGTLEPKYSFVVAPKIAGRLVRMAVQAGDRVGQGQLVAQLDDEELRLAVDEAQAALDVAWATQIQTESARDLARSLFERREKGRLQGSFTIEQLEAAESDLAVREAQHRVSAAQVASRETALQAAKVRLGYATVRADWVSGGGDGREDRFVGARYADDGALLRANDPICSILHTDDLVASLEVPERDYPRLAAGMPVSVMVAAWPGETFAGTLRARPVELSSTSRQARVEVDIPNPDHRLAPGMFVQAEVVYAQNPRAARVPVSALRQRGEGDNREQGVYAVERAGSGDGGPETGWKARFVPLQLGVEDLPWVEAISPALTAIVVEGQQNLLDGTGVRLSPEDAALAGG